MLVMLYEQNQVQIIGTIGGGAIEHYICAKAVKALENNQTFLLTKSLRNDFAMCCGGEMTVFIEVLNNNFKLLCFGAGHIAQALCPLAHTLGFNIHVFDSRPEYLALKAFKDSISCVEINNFSFAAMPWGKQTFVVVASHDHQLDQQYVENIMAYDYRYLALVGSQRKALMTKKRLLVKGFSEMQQQSLICPAGLNINAQTPQEIALSIMAQIVQVKNGELKNMCLDSSSRAESPYGIPKSIEAY